jgi:hypothetical protein
MAIIEDMLEGNLGTGLVVGVGALILGPVVTPLISGVAKPLMKTMVKGGIVAYDTAREYLAEAGEFMSDIAAEARAELAAAGVAETRAERRTEGQAGEGPEETSRPGGRKK